MMVRWCGGREGEGEREREREREMDMDMLILYTGAKIHQSGGKTRCIEQGGVNYTLEESSVIPEPIATCHEHAMEGLRKCREIESVITGLEKQSSNGTYFPVTVCRRPPPSPQAAQQWGHKSTKSDRRKRKSVGGQSPSSMSTMCQTSPSVLQLSDNMQVRWDVRLECHTSIAVFLSLFLLICLNIPSAFVFVII